MYNNNEKSDNENFKITFTLASKPKYLEIQDVHRLRVNTVKFHFYPDCSTYYKHNFSQHPHRHFYKIYRADL